MGYRSEALKGLHGTTTVGIVCPEGVVFSTDTRAIAGGYFIAHKRVKKILRIDDHLAMTIAGVVADAQNVVDVIRFYANMYKLENKSPIPVKSAARLASNVFFFSRFYPYIADVLVGGFDSFGPSVYNIDLFGSLTEEKYVSTGSGSPVAYGILESEFRNDLSISDAVALAIKAVSAAMKRNAGTGDSFDVAVIDKNGFRELSQDEKEEVLKRITGRL
ncbi:MAG: archaeal proteasome endopeptidase complex subunit beta [Nitrososphaerota archaeon]